MTTTANIQNRAQFNQFVTDFPIGSRIIIDGTITSVVDGHGWDHFIDAPFAFAYTPSRLFGPALDRVRRERITKEAELGR